MLETKDLILDKAKFSDWKDMYHNVWSHPESAKHMFWNVTTNEEDAKIRMEKTIEFQKAHEAYLVYEKSSGKAIGFAGIDKITDTCYTETGICLGPAYVGKGYGKQIVNCLINYSQSLGATEFVYFSRQKNLASNKLALSLGFSIYDKEEKIDERNGKKYILLKYKLAI